MVSKGYFAIIGDYIVISGEWGVGKREEEMGSDEGIVTIFDDIG
jgi:hypothetical protein